MHAASRLASTVALATWTLLTPACHRLSSAGQALSSPEAPAITPRFPVSPEALPPAPPATLTASDGTGLVLQQLTARAVLEGPLAFTEVRLTFFNPQPRVLEGTFKLSLPQGASLSRFAMKLGDKWQEGEVVERQSAREAYEDFLHKKRDPALLEQSAGNEFGARVFPIPAAGTKEILVSYAEELPGAGPYVFPLRGLPKLGSLDVGVSESGTNLPLSTLHEADWAPVRDVVVDRTALAGGDGLRSGELVVARVRPLTERRPDPIGAAVVLFDTSASRALGFEAQLGTLQALAAKVAESSADAAWTVACFDQSITEVYAGPVGGFDAAAVDRIRARRPLGASDLSRALAWAKGRAQETGAKRLLVVSDGVPTAGDTDRAHLVVSARNMASAGVERLDAIAVGGIRDDALLRAIATAGLRRDGVVAAAEQGPEMVAQRLGEGTQSGIPVKVDGARWWRPTTIDGAQAGDEFLVYAEVPDPTRVSMSVGKEARKSLDLRSVERPLIERAWAQSKIASLLDHEDAETDKAALRAQVVGLSTAHRVLSPYTALLVLETEWDYERFHIDRNALADILTVQGSRVALSHRKDAVFDPRPGQLRAADDASFGMIGLLPAAASAAPTQPAAPWSAAAEAPLAEAESPRGRGNAAQDSALGGTYFKGFAPGLGLSGAGEGGGGSATTPSRGVEGAAGHGRLGGGHRAASPPPSSPALAATEASGAPYSGALADVMRAIERHDLSIARQEAWKAHDADPGDVMALVALGEALEASGDAPTASRAYGSIIDLFPSRADMRRMAGERLERLRDVHALDLAADTYEKAVEERPDHPSGHRLLAFARLKQHDYAGAFDAALAGLSHPYPDGRFAGVGRILREDLGLIGAAWAAADPSKRDEIAARVHASGGVAETGPSLRFVLGWESDANDVDLHVRDAAGDHAFYGHRSLASGGELYADVTTGYGPECFTVRSSKAGRSPSYALQVHYYARGPMGYGMGKIEIIDHDGRGGLTFSERPFVVMNDRAFVELGKY